MDIKKPSFRYKKIITIRLFGIKIIEISRLYFPVPIEEATEGKVSRMELLYPQEKAS